MNKQEELAEVLRGIPSMALLPAKQFSFNVSAETYMFKFPNKGKFSDIDSEFFSDNDSEFEVCTEDGVNVSVVTKLLFATKQYPELEPNQLFCPINFKLDDGDVLMYGQVVTMLGVENDE